MWLLHIIYMYVSTECVMATLQYKVLDLKCETNV